MPDTNDPERVILFIDGFNVYHAIMKQDALRNCRWLDYVALGQILLSPEQKIEKVLYFTALYPEPGKKKRHQTFNQALKARGVEIILGEFRARQRYCTQCRSINDNQEEKQTDVSIAVELIRRAWLDEYDTAFVLSADSDLAPALRAMQRDFPKKNLHMVFPPGKMTTLLKDLADSYIQLAETQLRRNQLPETFSVGKVLIQKPDQW